MEGAIETVFELQIGRDAEAVIDGGDDVGGKDGAAAGMGADFIAGAVDGTASNAPAGQHDAWLWISGPAPDVTWGHARAAAAAVAEVASLAAERPAFTYNNGHDMTGFIDGTANPPTRRAPEVAMVPRGQPGEGGSHVLVMRWVHDLDRFWRRPVGEQETVIGRTKPDSAELVPARRTRGYDAVQ